MRRHGIWVRRTSWQVARLLMCCAALVSSCWIVARAAGQPPVVDERSAETDRVLGELTTMESDAATTLGEAVEAERRLSRDRALAASLSIFVLAVFVGFEVISKVPTTLHTPLMSGSNAISGITVVGAMVVAGTSASSLATWMGVAAIVLAMINVVGGFLVTHRMLRMFQRR